MLLKEILDLNHTCKLNGQYFQNHVLFKSTGANPGRPSTGKKTENK